MHRTKDRSIIVSCTSGKRLPSYLIMPDRTIKSMNFGLVESDRRTTKSLPLNKLLRRYPVCPAFGSYYPQGNDRGSFPFVLLLGLTNLKELAKKFSLYST